MRERAYHRKKREPLSWDQVRDQGSGYKQYMQELDNGPDNDPGSTYSPARTQQDVHYASSERHGGRPRISLTARDPFLSDPRAGSLPQQHDIDPSLVSAPVSRDGSGGSWSDPEPTVQSIKLTPAQVEAAKFSGLSIQEYARQLVELMKAKKRDPLRYSGQ